MSLLGLCWLFDQRDGTKKTGHGRRRVIRIIPLLGRIKMFPTDGRRILYTFLEASAVLKHSYT